MPFRVYRKNLMEAVMRVTGIIILTAIMLLTSCSKNGSLTFCEGKKPDESGVNCGTLFSTGDVMVLIKSDESFETDTLKVEIFEESGGKKKLRETLRTQVKPDDTAASILISLYSEGTFTINAAAGDRKIGSNTITMRHQ